MAASDRRSLTTAPGRMPEASAARCHCRPQSVAPKRHHPVQGNRARQSGRLDGAGRAADCPHSANESPIDGLCMSDSIWLCREVASWRGIVSAFLCGVRVWAVGDGLVE